MTATRLLKIIAGFIIVAVICFAVLSAVGFNLLPDEVVPYDPLPTNSGMENCAPPGPCVVIEDEGKKKVVEFPEVVDLSKKYTWEHVHIKALDHTALYENGFVEQIHAQFRGEVGCIIIVHAGDNEGYVYVEDKDLNVIYKEPLTEFVKNTASVDAAVMAKFYMSFH